MEGRDGGLAGQATGPEGQGRPVDRDDDRRNTGTQVTEAEDANEAEDEDATEAEGEDATEAEGEDATEAQAMIEVVGIDHIQLSMPSGGEDEARSFYVEILGLREVAKPPQLAGRGGCWFVGGDAAIHVAPEPDFRPLTKAHPALVIRDLARAREMLAAAGVAIEEDDSGLPVSRCYIRDPFGNRIELDDERDAGFSAR